MTTRHVDQAQFDSFATDYAERFVHNYFRTYALFAKMVSESLRSIPAHARIFDFACGTGWITGTLKKVIRGTYLGLDASEESLQELSSHASHSSPLQIQSIHADAATIEKPAQQNTITAKLGSLAHLIICNAAMHQIRKTHSGIPRIFSSLRDLLMEGGSAVFGDYNYPATLSGGEVERSLEWIRRQTGQNPTPPRGYLTMKTFERQLRSAGFQIVDSSSVKANDEISIHYYCFRCRK